jgi:hypothetical protein
MTVNFKTKCGSCIKSLCIPLAALLVFSFAGLMTPLIFNWHITMAGSAVTPLGMAHCS